MYVLCQLFREYRKVIIIQEIAVTVSSCTTGKSALMASSLSETTSIGVCCKNYSSVNTSRESLIDNSNESESLVSKRKTKSVFATVRELVRGPQRLWSVLLFSSIAAIGSAVTGMTLGYSSPASTSINTSFHGYPARVEVWNQWANSVFGSLSNVGAIFGSLFAILIADRAGRKNTLVFSNLPTVLGWFLITCAALFEASTSSMASYLLLIYIGRFLTGVGAGWTSVVVPMYIVEISPTLAKGLFGSMNQLAVTIGIFIVEALGIKSDFFAYNTLAVIPMILILIFVVLSTLFLQETPRWLVSRGRVKEAAVRLNFLRKVNFDEELEELQSALHAENITFLNRVKFLKEKPAYLALFFSISLLVLQQVCGINAIIFYASKILQDAGFNQHLANIYAAVGIGVIQVIFTFITVIVVDLSGRKILLFIGSVGSFLTTFVIGLYFLLRQDFHIKWPQALPVICVAVFIAAFALSWGPVPWVMVSEFSPITVRALIVGVATATNWLFAVIVTAMFDIGAVQKYPYVIWWVFSAFSLISIVFVLLVPETKGRSLQEIVHDLQTYKIFRVRKIC